MASYMAPSPSRQAGASSTSGNSDGHPRGQHSGTTRGALSGVMGASPFGVLATTPELPTSTLVLGPASPRPLLPTTESSSSRRPGLSLRRANSNSASGSGARASAGGAHGTATGRRGGLITLKRAGIALLLLQLVLGWLAFVYRPAWLAGVTGLVRSAPAAIFSHGTATGTDSAHAAAAAAAARATAAHAAHAAAATSSSRKERVGTTLGELAHREGVSTEGQTSTSKSATTTKTSSTTAAKTSHHHNSKATQQSVRLQSTAEATAAADGKKATDTTTAAAAKATAAAAAAASTAAVATSLKDTTAAAYPPFTVPVVPYANRVASPPRITGVVFYGRRSRVRILDCYLQRNMGRHGGLLTEVVFVRATWETADVAFLEKLVALRRPDYRVIMPQRLDVGYTGHYAWMDPAQIYVKIDDDVVFISDSAIDHMLAAHMLHRWHLISANVVNHQPLELPHSQRGAHTLYEQTVPGDKASWQPVMKVRKVTTTAAGGGGGNVTREVLEPVPFIDNGWDVWGDWKKAASVHYSFLANHASNKLGVYEFPHNEKLWDFNSHIGYTRWRINMILFQGAAIDVHVYNMSSTTGTYPGDDEDYITRILPQQLNKTSAAVSPALAVHFSFYMQRGGLENSTDLLDRYALLAERTCGRLLPPE